MCKRFLLCALTALLYCYAVSAKEYLVDCNLANVAAEWETKDGGTYALYQGKYFKIGETAFRSFADLKSVIESESTGSDVLYVAPGTYSSMNVSLNVPGLTILGNNANRDWTVTRDQESEITGGYLELAASGMSVNGLKFSDKGWLKSQTGTTANPTENVQVSYCYFTASTHERNNAKYLVQLGTRSDDANAKLASSQKKAVDCEVAHCYFELDGTHGTTTFPNAIAVHAPGGTTKIHDNYFLSGGTSVSIENGRDEIQIFNNVFKNVGVESKDLTQATGGNGNNRGDFCVKLYRCALDGETNAYIRDNEFDGCWGQENYNCLIRVYQGQNKSRNELEPGDDYVFPIGFKIYVNRNTFKNKTSIVDSEAISNETGSGYDDIAALQLGENLILYADYLGTTGQTTTAGVETEPIIYNLADNHYDNRFYKFIRVTLEDGITREVYADNFTRFNLAGTNSTFGNRYGTPWGSTSLENGGLDVATHATNIVTGINKVIQSFDIDPVTGDMYFLQEVGEEGSTNTESYNATLGISKGTGHIPTMLTRIKCTDNSEEDGDGFAYENLSSSSLINNSRVKVLGNAGHGIKICTLYIDGDLWIWTGGKANNTDLPTTTALFKYYDNKSKGPWASPLNLIEGAVEAGGGEAVRFFGSKPEGEDNVYPAVDEYSRHLCIRTNAYNDNKNVYRFYDLDDAINGKETLLKTFYIEKKQNANTNTNANGNSADKGYNTWDFQSFDIKGDYVYTLEGVSDDNANAITVDGKKEPTIVVSCYNWRTEEFCYRYFYNYGRIKSLVSGEPEGIVLKHDEFGHLALYVALVSGAAGDRHANVYKFVINRYLTRDTDNKTYQVFGDDSKSTEANWSTHYNDGRDFEYDKQSLTFAASDMTVQEDVVTVENTGEYHFGQWVGTITGEDGNAFDVKVSDNDAFTDKLTATVTFTPDGKKREYSAWLRLQSPLVTDNVESNDIMIPLSASYSGSLDFGQRPRLASRQVTETASDGRTLYSFNLAVDAMLPEPYDNSYLAYTNGKAADILPFRQLIDNYVVEIEPSKTDYISKDETTHFTIGTEKNAVKLAYDEAVSTQTVENVYVIDGYTLNGTIYPADNFADQLSVAKGVKVTQDEASSVDKKNDSGNYTDYRDVYNTPLVIHNVNPNTQYPLKVFMSGKSKYPDAWKALYLDYFDDFKSEVMLIPGTHYEHTAFDISATDVPEGVTTPYSSDRSQSAMPKGGSDLTPIFFSEANMLSSVGKFAPLNVTDEVFENWNVDYKVNVALTGGNTDMGNYNYSFTLADNASPEANNTTDLYSNKYENAACISYLPVKSDGVMTNKDVYPSSKIGDVDLCNIPAAEGYSFLPMVGVEYTRTGASTGKSHFVDNENVNAEQPSTATLISEIKGINAVTNINGDGNSLKSDYVTVSPTQRNNPDLNSYSYNAAVGVTFGLPDENESLPVYGIGYYFSNGFTPSDESACEHANETYVEGGRIIAENMLDYIAAENYFQSGYNVYSGAPYSEANNWSMLAKDANKLFVEVHHVAESEKPVYNAEIAIDKLEAYVTAEYPFLLHKSASGYSPALGISDDSADGYIRSDYNYFSESASTRAVSFPSIVTIGKASMNYVYMSNYITGMTDIEAPTTSLNIYPNPVGNHMTVVSSEVLGMITIYLASGSLIREVYTDSATASIEVGELSAGTYIVRAAGKSVIMFKK